jgi:hypothetical protein
LRYRKTTAEKGLIMTSGEDHRVDCYADLDFAGIISVEDAQDPVSVKSRSGYVILYCGTPLLWVSKLHTQIALSTMEAKCVALSQSMRDLIPICQVLEELLTIVFHRPPKIVHHAHSKAFDDVTPGSISKSSVLNQSTVYEDNQTCLKIARMAQLFSRTKQIGIPYHWFRSYKS